MPEHAIGWRRRRCAPSPTWALVAAELALALPWLLALAWLISP